MSTLRMMQFEPTFRRYIWGGRRLGDVLGKPIGDGIDYAESWEAVDHGADQSVVANGPLAGNTLGQIVREFSNQLFGRHDGHTSFPLLFKFLDANHNLSVQVHPDDQRAKLLNPPDRGKTEAWVILDTQPGSQVYAGLKRGFDRAALEREVARGTTELCLNAFQPRVGDCIFIPAGVVHALGAGLLVAEIQQSSDTTYRLFDWNRVDKDGMPRQLHVQQALDAIDYEYGPVQPQTPEPTKKAGVNRLVNCDKFVLDRWNFDQNVDLEGDDRFHLIVVLRGDVELSRGDQRLVLGPAQTALIPAISAAVHMNPSSNVELLDIYLP